MEKTYQIEITLNLRSKESAKDAVYAYLRELIDDDSLHFELVDRDRLRETTIGKVRIISDQEIKDLYDNNMNMTLAELSRITGRTEEDCFLLLIRLNNSKNY